jgi:transposase
MKPYSLDLREKIVNAVEKGESSFIKTAQRFSVSKSCVQKLVAQQRTEGHLAPRKQGGSVSSVIEHEAQLMAIYEKQPDATLAE